jgi:hypothetical protein
MRLSLGGLETISNNGTVIPRETYHRQMDHKNKKGKRRMKNQ